MGLNHPDSLEDWRRWARPSALRRAVVAVRDRGRSVDPALRLLLYGTAPTVLAALDSADGLVPMATDSTASLYRIDGAGGGRAARVVVRDGDERHIVPVRGPHARVSTTLPSGDAQRRLVVSAGNDFAREAEVTLDGRALEPVAGTQMPTYSVGADGGKLVIEPGTAWPSWRVAQLVLLGLVVFLAVPFGSARGRGRQ